MPDKHQQVEDPPGAAVAVSEGVDGLELVVRDGHAHEGIDAFGVVNEALPIGKLVAQQALADGRRVDDFATRSYISRRSVDGRLVKLKATRATTTSTESRDFDFSRISNHNHLAVANRITKIAT
jgi:hypothetical protein